MSSEDQDTDRHGRGGLNPIVKLLAIGAGLGGIILGGIATNVIPLRATYDNATPTKATTASGNAAPVDIAWVAAAPGRVEPKSGQVRISAGLLGRVAEVPVKSNDLIEEGELLIRLDDDEARARLSAAEAEAASRMRERDAQTVTAGREDVRKSEDKVFSAERTLTNAQFELEFELAAKRSGTGTDQRLADARKAVTEAKDKLQKERVAFATAQNKSGVPAPSRLDSAVSAARSDVAVAESLLQKTRIRAPSTGTILQLNAKVGEMVSPSPEQALVVIGDMSIVRVKAEVDEHDTSKIKVGQKAFVKNAAFPGKEFEGKVSEIAPSLAAPKITSRGARRPTDVDVLEVTIDLEGAVPLVPGMRADAFFRRD